MSAVPERMVRARAKELGRARRLAQVSLRCAGVFWVIMAIVMAIHLAGWDEPQSDVDVESVLFFGKALLAFAWGIVSVAGGIAGVVGLCAAVTAAVKGGLQRITVVALLVNAPLVIALVVGAVMSAW